MEFPFLQDLVLVFGLCVVVVLLFHRLHIPPVVGFLLTGALVGPGGLGLIAHPHQVEPLAEVGVVILLFSIGVDLSIAELIRLGRPLLLGGFTQVVLTAAAAALACLAAGLSIATGVFVGCLVALSSTTVMLRIVSDSGETPSPHGRVSLAICLFQDLCVIPMILIIPVLSGSSPGIGTALLTMAEALLVVAVVIVLARVLVPKLLRLTVKTKSRELFVMTLVFICLGTALLTSKVGLSLALGAFLAGLVLSESEYSHQALGEILPFRDALSSLFFVSVGMLFDSRLLLERPLLLAATVALVIVFKTGLGAIAVRLLGYPWRVGILSGALLAQVGEFSFVLAQMGRPEGLLPKDLFELFLGTAILSMALSPFVVLAGKKLTERRDLSEGKPRQLPPSDEQHVIVIGYGLNGRNLVRALQQAGIAFTIIEMNPEIVSHEKRALPIRHGDSTRASVLIAAGIHRARVIVIAISDASATRRTVELAKRLNAGIHIIARTRYLGEVAPLLALGADEVIPEELETSIEIFSRTLARYLIPKDEVDGMVHSIREDSYAMLREGGGDGTGFRADHVKTLFPGVAFEVLKVEEGSRLAGKTMADTRLRAETGLTVLAVRRERAVLSNPGPDFVFRPGDAAVVSGSAEELARGAAWFSS